jgi:hypothetical protein
MRKKAVGFYWTLPVPWVGFQNLPADVEAAAKASRTIRYQCECVRRYAGDSGYELIHEEVYIELQPDRGSDLVVEPLTKLADRCKAHNATILYVDFYKVQGWRSHLLMNRWLGSDAARSESIWPEPIMMDEQWFDPHEHFRQWREQQEAWSAQKPARAERACVRALELRAGGASFRAAADVLNAEKIPSLSGKPWTGANLIKLLASVSQ